jgi:peptide/nickel transport system permease protein
MASALLVSFLAGVAIGAWQAMHRGSRADRVAGTASLVVASLPEFWLGLVLLLIFAYKLPVLPGGGVVDMVMHDHLSPVGKVIDRLRHLVLPATTLALLGTASIARHQRAALLDVLPQDFVRTARAKGVGERWVIYRHALRNALVPTIVLAGLSLPALLGGAVFVEQIFSWQGMGWVAANAFASRDYHVVVGTTVLGAILVVIGGIVTDLLHAVVDPRVRVR